MARNFNQASAAPAADKKTFADGYINVFVTTEDGPVKIGFCALHKDSATEAQLIDWIEKDPANADKLGAALTFRYNSGTPKARGKLLLPE